MNDTGIEYADHSLNFWWGCEKTTAACLHCYAESRDAQYHPRGGANPSRQGPAEASHWGPGAPRLLRVEAARKEAAASGRRLRVFVETMGDFFEDRRDLDSARLEALDAMRLAPDVDWLLLTKRVECVLPLLKRAESDAPGSGLSDWLRAWLHWDPPKNIWVGVTVEEQGQVLPRIGGLGKVPAVVRWASFEPLLGPVDLDAAFLDLLDWGVAGGETGRDPRPTHPNWVLALRDQFRAAGTPFFFKRWGSWGPGSVHILSGEAVFRFFRDFRHWADKASTWVNGGLCLDLRGKVLKRGADFQDAAYPVAVLHRVAKPGEFRKIDGELHEALPSGQPRVRHTALPGGPRA